MNVAMNLAAAAGGAAARVAVDRFSNWMGQVGSTPTAPGPSRVAAPSFPSNAQVARGRARRGRGRGRGKGRGQGRQGNQPAQGAAARSGASITVRDTETFTIKKGTTAYQFNPSPDDLVRLKAFEKMYDRFRVSYVNVSFKSTSGTAVAGSVAIGVAAGPRIAEVKDRDSVMKLRPMFVVPAWKSDTLSLGKQVDSQKWMYCGDTTRDGVSFTLYVDSTDDSLGVVQVSYLVEFDFPKPFS